MDVSMNLGNQTAFRIASAFLPVSNETSGGGWDMATSLPMK